MMLAPVAIGISWTALLGHSSIDSPILEEISLGIIPHQFFAPFPKAPNPGIKPGSTISARAWSTRKSSLVGHRKSCAQPQKYNCLSSSEIVQCVQKNLQMS